MRLAELTDTSAHVAVTASRRQKIGLLTACLQRLHGEEIEIGVDYLAGRLRQGRIGLGVCVASTAMKVPATSTPSLTLADVDAAFERIEVTAGIGSATLRRKILAALFAHATPGEQEFLARLILGELRQGALEGVMIEALARAAHASASEVRRAVMVAGEVGPVAKALLSEGTPTLARFRLRVFTPMRPMLAQPADDVDDALRALGEVALEYKVDGARVQAHKQGDDVRLYTRKLNEVTAAVPELVAAVRALPAQSFILDGEAIARRADGAPQPFQVTMRRFGRKLDVETLGAALPLSVYFFDVLHLEGEDLVAQPERERFTRMQQVVRELAIPRVVTAEREVAHRFGAQALADGHEGVMAKALDAPYEPGRRAPTWLKIKRTHTLDLVVLAAEWGHGRRSRWLSNLHLGARDPRGGFVMLGKTFKGMTDEMLAWQTEALQARAIAQEGIVVRVRPELVVEVAFNDVQESPQYPAGLALRFARVKRYRPDKGPEEADTIETVKALYDMSTVRERS